MTQLTTTNGAVEAAPGSKLRAVTPSDSTNFADGLCRALYIGGSGNIAILAEDDTSAVTLSNVGAGQIIPVRAKRVNFTNTTATLIVAIY